MESNLQIISGKNRGKKLSLPRDGRPTQNRARIALFNMLNAELPDDTTRLTVWDAFAGSGAFGLECLSRDWAATAIFTDTNQTSINTVTKNANGFGGNIVIKQRDAIAAAKDYGPHADIVLIDPPFELHELGEKLIQRLAAAARPGTLVVWERDDAGAEPDVPNVFDILKDRKYGRARFLILKKAIN